MNSENKTQFYTIMTDSGDIETPEKESNYREAIGKKSTCSYIGIVIDRTTREEVKSFRKIHYSGIYPAMDLDNDVLDDSALTLYTRNKKGYIDSTARLSVDNPHGFPQEQYLMKYRESGVRLMELGRFIIDEGNLDLLKDYYCAFYSLAKNLQSDAIVMSMQPHHISLHQKLIGACVIAEDTGGYDGPYSLSCVVWDIRKTNTKFLKWIGGRV